MMSHSAPWAEALMRPPRLIASRRRSQVEAADLRVVEHRGAGALQPHAAAFHDDAVRCQSESGPCVLLDQQDGSSRLVHGADGVEDDSTRLRVETHRGLVE